VTNSSYVPKEAHVDARRSRARPRTRGDGRVLRLVIDRWRKDVSFPSVNKVLFSTVQVEGEGVALEFSINPEWPITST
jgi:hypothetical protein